MIFGGIILLVLGAFIATQNTQSRLPIPMVTVGIVLLILAAVLPAKAQEQRGHTHVGAIGQFYQSWMRPDNRAISCCHDKDCAPAQSKLVNGSWHARNSDDEDWVEVPASRIERDRDSPDGQSHLCKAGVKGGINVYCFLPASSS